MTEEKVEAARGLLGTGYLRWKEIRQDQEPLLVMLQHGLISDLEEALSDALDEAVAQRAAREAAERERDEARALIVKERAGGDADREWLTTERDEARAALAASTEREAGLAKLCRDTIRILDRIALANGEAWSDVGDDLIDRLAEIRGVSPKEVVEQMRADRLASLAAPEGGTDGK